MVMLDSYESSQQCACRYLWVVYSHCGAFHLTCREFKLWWLGFCRPWALAQGLQMVTINIQVQCPVLLVGLATVWIGVWWSQKYSAEDASISLSHYPLEEEDWGRDEKVGKYCGDGLLQYREDEMRVSRLLEEREGRTRSIWLVKLHG